MIWLWRLDNAIAQAVRRVGYAAVWVLHDRRCPTCAQQRANRQDADQ